MEFRDYNYILSDIYKLEKIRIPWKKFIRKNDLGLVYKKTERYEKGPEESFEISVYKVVDEQKWMLTRLKYGI